MTEIQREQTVRRRLAKQGFALRKTPARSRQRDLYGVGYMIVDQESGTAVSGASPYPYSDTLEDVEAFAAH